VKAIDAQSRRSAVFLEDSKLKGKNSPQRRKGRGEKVKTERKLATDTKGRTQTFTMKAAREKLRRII
jgi:hypothetical protein